MSAEDLDRILSPGSPNVPIVISREDLVDLINRANKEPATEWLTASQVASRFGIAYNNIKDARWRKRVGLPTHQPGGSYCRPIFDSREVSEWIRSQ